MHRNMKATQWLVVLGLLALLGSACGSTQNAARSTTATRPSASPFTTYPLGQPGATVATAARQLNQCQPVAPAPTFAPAVSSSRNLVLAWFGTDSSKVVIRDITDINHPTTVGLLNPAASLPPQFVSATDISYSDQTGLERAPLSGSPVTTVTKCGGTPFAWSPDGTAAAYMGPTADPKVQQLHLVRGGRDTAAGTAPALSFGVGCESRACGDSWDIHLLYSPDGAYISLVEQLPVPAFRIWTADGKLLKSLDGGTMSVWSGDTLYWRDEKGVETWRAGTESLLLPGVSWVRPHASPSGGQIVYETRDAGDTTAHVLVLDTASGKVHELKSSRAEPAYLNAHLIWYKGEVPCAPGDCLAPTTDSGKYYIYDLNDGSEAQSVISAVWDVWPHPA